MGFEGGNRFAGKRGGRFSSDGGNRFGGGRGGDRRGSFGGNRGGSGGDRRGSFGGNRGGDRRGSFGGGSRFGGNRSFGGRSDRNEGEPIELGKYLHPCEGHVVVSSMVNEKVPKFGATVQLSNGTEVGTVEDVLGPTASHYFVFKPIDGVAPDSFKDGDSFFVKSGALLPIDFFTHPKPHKPRAKPGKMQQRGGFKGKPRGGFGGKPTAFKARGGFGGGDRRGGGDRFKREFKPRFKGGRDGGSGGGFRGRDGGSGGFNKGGFRGGNRGRFGN
eukprot:gnl/Dysnectes_brevis/1268_a1422_1782.p2 GENE.gnl/Dysnectes_brevis/1268_a1422_1782~~gnl/Dysnectes_brevis/1268_a1422_1782.p2  ORF type:complete len:273 (-),score=77.80 gnl/Dysnectes_brevis/1268_a1422_1782:38-856(-)